MNSSTQEKFAKMSPTYTTCVKLILILYFLILDLVFVVVNNQQDFEANILQIQNFLIEYSYNNTWCSIIERWNKKKKKSITFWRVNIRTHSINFFVYLELYSFWREKAISSNLVRIIILPPVHHKVYLSHHNFN